MCAGLLLLLAPQTATLAQGGAPAAVVRVLVRTALGPAAHVLVTNGSVNVQTDESGRAMLRLAVGSMTLRLRRLGFAPDSVQLTLHAGEDTTVVFLLREEASLSAPVFVSSTRIERRVEEEPLRVEVLAGEDVGEKTQMHPADLRVLLTEMSGVRIQTTSPSLGAAAVRIQGLRGRYTQILTDGLPLYGARAGSFGLLQIPPLELRQAEVIKGAASALYGPNALGGVLNLVSRRPPDSSEAIVNQTRRAGSDLVMFGSKSFSEHAGATLLAGAHTQRATDLDGDGWSDLPGFRRIEVRPRLHLSDASGRSLMVTMGAFAEDRGGGSAERSSPGAFPESLTTRHADAGATGRMQLADGLTLAMHLAANAQTRDRRFGSQREHERASTLFGELAATYVAAAQTLLVGVADQEERYHNADVPQFDESRSTPAVFLQHTYAASDWFSTQLNGRCDASSAYGTVCTPRLSVLAHASTLLSVRASVGAGWSAPLPLTEETEVFGLTRLTGPFAVSAERARTVSVDVGSVRGPLEVSGTLFTSRVKDPIGLRRAGNDTIGRVAFVNAAGPSFAHGGELFAVYHEEPIIVTAFYAATRTQETSPESGRLRESPYVPRESAGLDAAFEEDESSTRIGVELFYTGPQAVDENPYRSVAPAYTTVGILASQRIGRANVYVNLDNLTNVRQTRFDPLLRPTPGEGGRRTVDEWAPLEGRSINIGVRVRL
ncbi:MAG: TonB-dependent receptor [Gemmatimonadaceae bacterium]